MSSGPNERSSTWMVPIGILTGVVGAGATGLGLVVAALSTNACGAFADGCDDYGEPAASFLPSVAVTVLGGVAFVIGLVLVVAGMSRSPNRRREDHGQDGTGGPHVGAASRAVPVDAPSRSAPDVDGARGRGVDL